MGLHILLILAGDGQVIPVPEFSAGLAALANGGAISSDITTILNILHGSFYSCPFVIDSTPRNATLPASTKDNTLIATRIM